VIEKSRMKWAYSTQRNNEINIFLVVKYDTTRMEDLEFEKILLK